MAPATGLRLLHIAAVLVMMASSGTVLAESIFNFTEFSSTFKVLRERQCLPDDFPFLPSTSQTKGTECVKKVLSGNVPSECVGTPIMAQFYNCYANSMGYLVTVNGAKSFDVEDLKDRMLALSNNETWREALSDQLSQCQRMALSTLTPQQLAAYSYMCIQFSLFADCDRQQDLRGSLDLSALQRREHFIVHGVDMMVEAIGSNAADVWAECSQNIVLEEHHDHVEDAAQHYAEVLSATACFLRDLFDEAGLLDTGRLFEQIESVIAPLGLKHLEDHCGPNAAGYQSVTAEQFTQCLVTEGTFLQAAYESNVAAASMSESCTISV